MSYISKEKIYINEEKTMSYVSKVNKKNTSLKQNNNEMSYVSEVIKKISLGKKYWFVYILIKITIITIPGGI